MGKHKDWTEYLKDALQNAELPVEDSGWAHRTISAQQASSCRIAGATFSKGLGKRRAGGWTIVGLAAAAAIVLCVLLWYPGTTTPDGLVAELTKGLAKDHIEGLAGNSEKSIIADLTADLTAGSEEGVTVSSFHNPYLAIASDIRELSDDNCPAAENPNVTENSDELETDPTVHEDEPSVPDSPNENVTVDDITTVDDDLTAWKNDIDSRRAERDRRKISIDLSGSMGSAASAGSLGLGLFAIDREISTPHVPSWDDLYEYHFSAPDVAHNTNVTDKFTHRQPVTFALTVGIPLNERFSLASGIQFSRVQSTFHYTGKDVEQELNYIGIPLQAQYRLTGNGLFRTYAAAGVLGEKLVGGYIGDKRVTGEKIQMSLSASLGARVQLRRDFSLRLEPGIRYYMTDSEFFTYRTGRPFVFSITFGASIDL